MEILTGNELISGASVYLDARGIWVEDLQAARLFSKEETAERDGSGLAEQLRARLGEHLELRLGDAPRLQPQAVDRIGQDGRHQRP